MPKHSTFPTLFDDALQINITKLKEWEYLKSNQIRRGTITWSWNGSKTGSISLKVNTRSEQPYIELDYNFRDNPRNYIIPLVSIPSNLGIGRIWFFLCPQTNKRCRKLYSIGGYFFHREAFNGCMYESQTRSKKDRLMTNAFGIYFKADQFYEEINKKHFKKFYNGKPTKKYLKMWKEIRKANEIPSFNIKDFL